VRETEPLAQRALAFAAQCHSGQRRVVDGRPFITHPLEVARLLRDAGCLEPVVAAGLLHDVVEHADVREPELRARFGEYVATLVLTVSGDPHIECYRDRKRMLREQVHRAGGNAALVFAADKVSKVRDWPGQLGRRRARLEGVAAGSRVRRRFEEQEAMRLEHYGESLAMLESIVPGHALVLLLATELARVAATAA
jgi:hypothetical protein